jgi:hypothetical protein
MEDRGEDNFWDYYDDRWGRNDDWYAYDYADFYDDFYDDHYWEYFDDDYEY